MIFVLVIHGRKSIMKSIDFSKMTPTTTYSFKKNMCFCISWKMHQKMKRFSNVFLTIFKHVLGNVRFNPTKAFIKMMIFFNQNIFVIFFKCFSTVREHEFLLWTMTLCVDRGKTLQKNHQKCWFLNEVQFFQGFHRVKSFDFSKNTDFASWWFSVGFLYHFWRCVLAFWIDIKIL